MIGKPSSADPQSVFYEVCFKRAPAIPPHELQEGAGRSIARDERVKRATRQHPQRDEPKADSVERDELPPS